MIHSAAVLAVIILTCIVSALPELKPAAIKVVGADAAGATVQSVMVRGEHYLSLVETAALAGGKTILDGDSVIVTLADETLRFQSGSPFASLKSGRIIQFPLPVVRRGERFWAPAGPLARLLTSVGSRQLLWDGGALMLTVQKSSPMKPAVAAAKPGFPQPQAVEPPPAVQPDLSADRDKWALDVVVIDPGHGGKDPGAIGTTKLKEKDVSLDVALRLDMALRSKGIKTVMTRSTDVFVPLAERTSIANRSGGKLFVSLHCNAAKSKKAGGVETYFLAPTKSDRAMEVAMRENEVIKYEESRDQYHDLTEENYILLAMAQAQFTTESQELAGMVQEQVSRRIGLKDRGVDQAGFYVLIGASMPAILFEMAFLSNKEEEKKLKDGKFRQKIADEIAETVIEFLRAKSKG